MHQVGKSNRCGVQNFIQRVLLSRQDGRHVLQSHDVGVQAVAVGLHEVGDVLQGACQILQRLSQRLPFIGEGGRDRVQLGVELADLCVIGDQRVGEDLQVLYG